MAKKKPRELKSFAVPLRLTIQGEVFVEAEDAERALDIVSDGEWEDESFYARAEITDSEVRGKARDLGF